MSDISMMRSPSSYVDRFPVAHAEGLAAGTGDNTEVTSEPVSVLGTNAGRASSHGVVGVQYEALEVEMAIRTSLAAAETLQLLNLTWQQAPPDSSGDPDTFVDVANEAFEASVITLAAIPETVLSIAAGGAILLATGALTDALILLRFHRIVRIPTGQEFWRFQFTLDLSAGVTDTFDATAVLAGIGNTPAYRAISS